MELVKGTGNAASPVPSTANATITFNKETSGNINTIITFNERTKNDTKLVLDTYYGRIFACYSHSSSTVALFRKRTGKLSVSQYGYTTYTSQEYNYIMPKGCLGFVVTKENDGIKLTEKYKPGDAVPAKTPLLIKAAPGTYPIYQTEYKGTAPAEGENLLRGEFDAEGNITYGSENKGDYYLLLSAKP